jgi:mRNA interferase YafQ
MRTIERSTAFRRDYPRIKAAPAPKHRRSTDGGDRAAGRRSAAAPSQPRHALTGNWAGYRECHVRPDLLLIYGKPDDGTLRLVRLGSHSDLFG